MKNDALLQLLSRMGSNGRAECEDEGAFCKMFYPVPEQMKALDPDVTLILGGRGSGKTSLFRAVAEFGLTETFRNLYPKARIPEFCNWVGVDLVGKTVPDQTRLRRFFGDPGTTEDQAHDFWQCLLVRDLWHELDEEGRKGCMPMKKASSSIVEALLDAAKACSNAAASALDRLDDRLEHKRRILFVGYDDLDLLVTHSGRAASTLIGFWASRSRRWNGIRAKLFMRSDTYRRFGVEGGPDLAKISANRMELNWSDESLLGLLVKRILNTDVDNWRKKLGIKKNQLWEDPLLGWSHYWETPENLRSVVHALLGPYMGAGPKKGATQTWIIDHIKDCRGNAVPRFLVRMFELAAELQIKSDYAGPTLLAPMFLRQALTTISEEHVKASLPEWPWLEGFKQRVTRLSKLRNVPFERKSFEVQMRKNWNDSWGSNVDAPCEDPGDFVPMLLDSGILRERKDGRLETTDLYLDGLGFKRKGGVRRRAPKSIGD